MAFTTNSANMLLPVPTVGTEPGPQYAQDINNCLTIIDQHDHSPQHGVPVTPAGLNINADLTFANNNATNLRSTRFFVQSAALAGASDLDCLYVTGVDLYYNDGSGNQVRITQNGGVAGSPGSISNLTSPASASYVSADQTFVWQSAANTPANMDGASYILRNLSASSFGLTLSPPTLTSDYTITLPTLPSSTLPVSISTGGVMSASPITLAQLIATVQQALNPAGSILAYGGTGAPTGYLACDGSAVSRTTYSALFTAVGTAYGSGDGSTTFNVPDLRGQFLRGVTGASANDPDASSRTANNSGGNTGNNVGSQQASQFASHQHEEVVFNSSNWYGQIADNKGAGVNGTGGNPSSFTNSVGGNETRPINVYVNFIIKT